MAITSLWRVGPFFFGHKRKLEKRQQRMFLGSQVNLFQGRKWVLCQIVRSQVNLHQSSTLVISSPSISVTCIRHSEVCASSPWWGPVRSSVNLWTQWRQGVSFEVPKCEGPGWPGMRMPEATQLGERTCDILAGTEGLVFFFHFFGGKHMDFAEYRHNVKWCFTSIPAHPEGGSGCLQSYCH